MQKISFKLEVFEGPMDLLLSLITKHKLNIYDIEISSLLEQYLAYLDQCREQDLELAGEFLEMAARLIYIKTVSLLPRPEEAQKEKQALQGALIEFALCKQAAGLLAQQFVGGQVFVRKPMKVEVSPAYAREHPPRILLETWIAMGQKQFAPQDTAKDRLQRVVSQPVVSVMSKVVYVMRKVYHNEHVYFGALYADVRERSARVALFLAVLELTKHGRIGISEDGTYLYRRLDRMKKKDRKKNQEAEEPEATENDFAEAFV
jgi:segregation and condensation protein A